MELAIWLQIIRLNHLHEKSTNQWFSRSSILISYFRGVQYISLHKRKALSLCVGSASATFVTNNLGLARSWTYQLAPYKQQIPSFPIVNLSIIKSLGGVEAGLFMLVILTLWVRTMFTNSSPPLSQTPYYTRVPKQCPSTRLPSWLDNPNQERHEIV